MAFRAFDRRSLPISAPEPRALFSRYRATGDHRAREAIITRYLPLSRSLARRFATGAELLEDLEQVAALALVKAVDAYEPERGIAFSSYAVPCISGAIKRHFRDCGWSLRVPRELKDQAITVHRLEAELQASVGRAPTVQQLAAATGLGAESVLDARQAYRAMYASSLDTLTRAEDDGDRTLLDVLGEPDEHYTVVLDRSALDMLLEQLPSRDRTIIELYFRRELTQTEIGRQLGYSQMHISRLLRRAVQELERVAG
jgi:RNA polymerase sigma-B factor